MRIICNENHKKYNLDLHIGDYPVEDIPSINAIPAKMHCSKSTVTKVRKNLLKELNKFARIQSLLFPGIRKEHIELATENWGLKIRNRDLTSSLSYASSRIEEMKTIIENLKKS